MRAARPARRYQIKNARRRRAMPKPLGIGIGKEIREHMMYAKCSPQLDSLLGVGSLVSKGVGLWMSLRYALLPAGNGTAGSQKIESGAGAWCTATSPSCWL